ncbi:protein phosphatase 2C domain-containing protein [Streptomyces salinarius]|uniref:protein phosphatase 2C domain-containing protein n=1 Tax=Streptomyces salinarius TaxID=2762598 RepID=UPI002852CB91|nr:protein phosphatase 2C domain-containing protein [Streptomyces salinarius]
MFVTAHATAQQQGGRSHQCDATAVTAAHGGVVAFAVLDGIGSSPEVARFTRQAAHRLTRAAVRTHSAEAAVRQVSHEIDVERFHGAEDGPAACALVVLVVPGEPLRLAWRGDVRAYVIRDGQVEQLTRDHNRRRVNQDKGRPVGEYDRNTVTSCLGDVNSADAIERFCGHDAIETATVDPEELRLVLATDGAYEPIEDLGRSVGKYLTGFPAQAAAALTATAVMDARITRRPQHVDNASVMVVDLVP